MDEKYAKLITDTCNNGDAEGDHIEADWLLIKLLNELGYTKTVAAWQKVDKWYA